MPVANVRSKWVRVSGNLVFYEGKPGAQIHFGEDASGFDVKFFGATTGKYMLWDESADKLIIEGSADLGSSCEADAYTVGGIAGVDFSGAVTNLTVVKGIVTAAS
jgi:hypothetical protein